MTTVARAVHVVGTGLIGASVALGAARAGWVVTVEDPDADAAAWVRTRVAARTAGEPSNGAHGGLPRDPDIVVVAVPPDAVGSVVSSALSRYVDATITDACSIKAQPLADVERLGGDLARYVPGHPIAGSEGSGPAAARAGLFDGRTWALCPTPTNGAALAGVGALVDDLGATAVLVPAEVHDAALAVTSHLPQVVASALAVVVARSFAGAGSDALGGDVAASPSELSGPALLDMTRVAASPADLWATIASANAGPLATAVRALVGVLGPYADELADPSAARVATAALVRSGAQGRVVIAGKHGGRAPTTAPAPRLGAFGAEDSWTWVDVVVADEPGALASLFATAAALDVNIEDLHVDHAPHRSTGVVSLAVRTPDAERLRSALDT